MEQIKKIMRNMSLRKSITLYITIFTVIALVLSTATAAVCDYLAECIYNSYPISGEKYYLTNDDGERLGEGVYIIDQVIQYSPEDEKVLSILNTIPTFASPAYSALCIIAAAFLFYKNKLKLPLYELSNASKKIAENDLNFQVFYKSNDEIGKVCNSYEIMRATLADNFTSMWRQVEERKQLNAAFAHDLRTPLTVIKGYDEMLVKNKDPVVRDTAMTIKKHINRMENYISSMSTLRRLEDSHPEYIRLELQPYLKTLEESASLFCKQGGKTLRLENNVYSKELWLDPSFVSQVIDNLLSNAIRYANQKIVITVEENNGGLILSVFDDGNGFSDKTISCASNPYFTSEADHFKHFGIGLYICKLLCENHNGNLKLENVSEGAKVTAFFKSASL